MEATPKIIEPNFISAEQTPVQVSDKLKVSSNTPPVNATPPAPTAIATYHTHNGVDAPLIQFIRIGSGSSSLHLEPNQGFWIGADEFSVAPFSVSLSGALVASSVTITGGTVAASTINGTLNLGNLNVSARGWVQSSVFSITDADTIAWGAGTFTSADGTAYSITGGNTGNMVAKTYIYLDIGVSTTVYQTTTTATTAVGAGKVLIAIAQNGTGEATYQVLQGQGGQNIDAGSIVANSITANELSTSITYAGSIVIDTAGLIRSGQTAYDTGTGWWIGNDAGTPKLSIGISTGAKLTWNGTTLRYTNRVVTTTQSATPTVNTDLTDVVSITGLAQAITSMTTNLSGTPVVGDVIIFQITDDGTARAITWGASFASTLVSLPLTTVISAMLRVGFQWNAVTSKWDCIALA